MIDVEHHVDNRTGELYYDCPNCLYEMKVTDDVCSLCRLDTKATFSPTRFATFHAEAWEYDFQASFSESTAYSPNVYKQDELPGFNDMLCCDLPAEKCNCDEPLSFNTAMVAGHDNYVAPGYELTDYAYDTDNVTDMKLCETCSHHGTYRCKPLRQWLREISEPEMMSDNPTGLDNKMMYISPCLEYVPSSTATSTDIDFVLEYLHQESIDEGYDGVLDEFIMLNQDPFDDDEDMINFLD